MTLILAATSVALAAVAVYRMFPPRREVPPPPPPVEDELYVDPAGPFGWMRPPA